MDRTWVQRILAVSAAPVGEVPEDETPLLSFILRPLIWRSSATTIAIFDRRKPSLPTPV